MERKIKVLYLHSTAAFGGASKSLSELSSQLSNKCDLYVITPRGSAAEFFKHAGMKVHYSKVSQFAVTSYGYYRGLRWLLLIREILYLPITYYKINKFLSENEVDLVHLNEVTLIQWVILFKKKRIPVIVHVRSLYKEYENSLRDRYFLYLLKNYVDKVIAIDETVKKSLPETLSVNVIHNALKFNSKLPDQKQYDNSNASVLNVCIVGSLLRLKGHYEFIGAAQILLSKNLNIKFHIVGSSPRRKHFFSFILKWLGFYNDVEGDLINTVNEYNLHKNIIFHGMIKDIAGFYKNMDLVCFPSFYNAPGRPVFEAAYFGIPSIVAVSNPTSDTIIDYKTGMVIDRPCPILLANKIEELYNDRNLLIKLGDGARILAENYYLLEKNANKVFDIYKALLKGRFQE